jgi:4-hydroxybenzoate polyprenyltransferase
MSGKLLSYIRLLRPKQWIKNLLLLFPPFFAGKMFQAGVIEKVLPALAAFSLVSSCGYIINDIKDSEADKRHQLKKRREIANGRVSVAAAVIIAVILYAEAMIIAMSIHGEFRRFQWFLVLYLFNSLIYTLFFKNHVIVDICLIAAGFLIRVLAGGEAFRVPVTSWLFLTVFSVSLLLAAGKRLGELLSLNEQAHKHRQSLASYSASYLEGILWFSAAASLVMYALYTLEHKNGLFYTVPLVTFGLLRYIFIVKEGKGDPTETLFMDRQILGVGVLWLVVNGIIIYA